MQHTISMIKKFFENHDLHYEFDGDSFFAELDWADKLTNIRLAVVIKEDNYFTYAFFPHKVPKESFGRVAEYLHRANAYQPYCNFELDYYEAEIRVKSHVDFEYCKISYSIAETSIVYPLSFLATHANSLMRTMYSTESVEQLLLDALEDAEEDET